MLQESRTFIINDYDKLQKKLKENKPSIEKRKSLAKSLNYPDMKKMKEVYNS